MTFAEANSSFGARQLAIRSAGLALLATATIFPMTWNAARAQVCIEPTAAERRLYPNRAGCNDSPTPQSPPPTPRGGPTGPIYTPPVLPQTAVQKALPRYRALLESLSEYKLADTESWLNLPLGSDAEFLGRANALHRILATKIANDQYLKENALHLSRGSNAVIQTYPNFIARLRSEIAAARLKQSHLGIELEFNNARRELTQRTANQLEARALRFESATQSNKEAVLAAFSVLLPPRVARLAAPRPYEPIFEPLVGALPERERIRRPSAIDSVRASPPFVPVRPSLPRPPVSIAPLPASVEQAVGQLEREGATYRAANTARWGTIDRTRAADSAAAGLRQDYDAAKWDLSALAENVRSLDSRVDDAEWALLLAKDALQSAQATFLYRAADAWIWENAKPELIEKLKDAVELTTRKSVNSEIIEAASQSGKQNILGLPNNILASGGAYVSILKSYAALLTRSEDYMLEVPRLLARASPQDIEAFLRKKSEGIDESAQELANSSLDATGLPEPFRSIAIKYLLSDPNIIR